MMHSFAWRPVARAALIPALMLAAAPAFAQTTQDSPANLIVHHTTVSYGDLDLTTAKGRTALDRRLRRSASEVCNYDMSERRSLGDDAERTCYTTALAHARTSMAAAVSQTRMASRQ